MDASDVVSATSAVDPKDAEQLHSTFIVFPDLSAELQNMIWEWPFEPRTIEIASKTDFYTTAKFPIALRVCQSSRKAVIDTYPYCFGSIWYQPTISFNLPLDTVCLTADRGRDAERSSISLFFRTLRAEEITKLRYLAVSSAVIQGFLQDSRPSQLQRLQQSLKALTSLEEIIIMGEILPVIAKLLEGDKGKYRIDVRRDVLLERPNLTLIVERPGDIPLSEEDWKESTRFWQLIGEHLNGTRAVENCGMKEIIHALIDSGRLCIVMKVPKDSSLVVPWPDSVLRLEYTG